MRNYFLIILFIVVVQQKSFAQEVHTVAPSMYKVLADTMGIRVLEATYRPGQSSAMHSHPDFAMYVLEGGDIEIIGKTGSKQVVEFKTGMGLVLPPDAHMAKNVGKTTVKLVVTEIRRPAP